MKNFIFFLIKMSFRLNETKSKNRFGSLGKSKTVSHKEEDLELEEPELFENQNISNNSVSISVDESDILTNKSEVTLEIPPQIETNEKKKRSRFGNIGKSTSSDFKKFSDETTKTTSDTKSPFDMLLTVTWEFLEREKIPYSFEERNLLFENTPRRKIADIGIGKVSKNNYTDQLVGLEDVDSFLGDGNNEGIKKEKERIKQQRDKMELSSDIKTIIEKFNMSNFSVVSRNTKTKPNGSVTIDDFITSIETLWPHFSDEERGLLMITIIFGGLIARSKFTGPAAKNAIKNLSTVSDALNKVKDGIPNSQHTSVYEILRNLIISNKLSPYRQDTSIADQIAITSRFIERAKNRETYFPHTFTYCDTVGQTQKSITLQDKPTLDEIRNFFTETQSIKTNTNTNRRNDDDDYDDDNDNYGGSNKVKSEAWRSDTMRRR